MKGLLIAEKPSVMRDIQSVYEKMKLPYQLDFGALRGHVVGLAMPDEYEESWGKPWREEVLPMIPSKFKYNVIKETSDVFNSLRKKIENGSYSFIINATDAGREGEHIFGCFIRQVQCNLPVKRFWASDPTEATIQKALLNLIDENDEAIKRLWEASYLRSHFDWLVGMNFSRAITLTSKSFIPVGRVMTPTLAIVARREKEIQDFIAKDYFEIEADFQHYKGTWYDSKTKEKKISNEKQAESILKNLKGQKEGVVAYIKENKKTFYAPTLHSLLELQKEAGKLFGYTASQVLSIAQVLYEEKKLISYPRTDSRHIPKNLATEIKDHLEALVGVPKLGDVAKDILSNPSNMNSVLNSKKYVDDKKVTDHHASATR